VGGCRSGGLDRHAGRTFRARKLRNTASRAPRTSRSAHVAPMRQYPYKMEHSSWSVKYLTRAMLRPKVLRSWASRNRAFSARVLMPANMRPKP